MGGHRASGGAEGDLVDGPVDLAAVRADDALIDALAGGAAGGPDYGFGAGGSDDEQLAAILAAWRADIEADPMPELVTLDEAAEAVEIGHESRDRLRTRARRRMPFAIAAAAAAVACAGLTVAVHGAVPGDALWGVSKVFFSERAQSVERVQDVRNHIERANDALARGDQQAARNELAQANVTIPQVEPEQRAPLVQERDRVQGSIDNEPATGSTSSGGGSTSAEPSEPASSGPGATEPSNTTESPTATPTPSPQDPATVQQQQEPATPRQGTTTTQPSSNGSSSTSPGN